MCGKLVKSMYGTRDAAQNWEEEYTGFMEEIGFDKGLGSPCVFYHDDRKLRAVIHGDDFTISGKENQLNWFKENINNKFEVKFKARLGPEENDDKSVRVLNRVVEWNERGISYEPDQRHAEIIVRELTDINGMQRLSTPGRRTKREELREDDEEELQSKQATAYRALVARANYLSQDRTDIRFAVKELSRHMSKPRKQDHQ